MSYTSNNLIFSKWEVQLLISFTNCELGAAPVASRSNLVLNCHWLICCTGDSYRWLGVSPWFAEVKREKSSSNRTESSSDICPAKSSSNCHQNRRNFHVIFTVIPTQIKQQGNIALREPEQACFKNWLFSESSLPVSHFGFPGWFLKKINLIILQRCRVYNVHHWMLSKV